MGPKLIFALAATFCLVLASYVYWPAPESGFAVPRLAITRQAEAGMRAELVPAAKDAGLIRLPATISGRAAEGPGPGAYRHQWPTFHAEARFKGAKVTVRVDDQVNRLRVAIDGGTSGIVEIARPGNADLRIEGLSNGEHVIRLEKISESPGPAVFGGFYVASDGDVVPAPAASHRLIEFIGDSDTVGYGNTSRSRDCSETQLFAATETPASFGPRAATHFGADYRMLARSGVGLVRNYEGAQQGASMPQQYARALLDDPGAMPAPEEPADIFVIGLGSNDFGSKLQTGEPWQDFKALRPDFQAALVAFSRARLRQSPHAVLLLLAFGEYGEELVGAYRAAADTLRNEGARTALVVLPKLDRHGCHWHPSPKDHAMIAEHLIAAISTAEPTWVGSLQSTSKR